MPKIKHNTPLRGKPEEKNHLLAVINAMLSMAILSYVISVEHRLTSLEIKLEIQETKAPVKSKQIEADHAISNKAG